jgi:hypothetical protein
MYNVYHLRNEQKKLWKKTPENLVFPTHKSETQDWKKYDVSQSNFYENL